MTKVRYSVDLFGHTLVDAAIKEVLSERVGFINTECTFVKTLLKGIAYKVLDSAYVFTDETKTRLNNVLNKLTYD